MINFSVKTKVFPILLAGMILLVSTSLTGCNNNSSELHSNVSINETKNVINNKEKALLYISSPEKIVSELELAF